MGTKSVIKNYTISIKDKKMPMSEIKKEVKESFPDLSSDEIKVISRQLKTSGVVWNYKTLLSLEFDFGLKND